MLNSLEEKILESFDIRARNFAILAHKKNDIISAVKIIVEAIKNNNKLLFCGNGGSASDSNHLTAEFISRFKKERSSYPAISLSANNSIVTAIANDYGFENVFKRQIEGLGDENDVLIAISTSGKSKNVLKAIEQAKKQKLKTILLTGKNEENYDCDVVIKVSSIKTEEIQEMHIAIGHIICEIAEKELNRG